MKQMIEDHAKRQRQKHQCEPEHLEEKIHCVRDANKNFINGFQKHPFLAGTKLLIRSSPTHVPTGFVPDSISRDASCTDYPKANRIPKHSQRFEQIAGHSHTGFRLTLFCPRALMFLWRISLQAFMSLCSPESCCHNAAVFRAKCRSFS